MPTQMCHTIKVSFASCLKPLNVSFICLPEMPDFASLQNFAANIDADIGSDEELSGDENELMVSQKCNKFL